MLIRKAVFSDIKEITDIYNHAILNLTATFDEEIKSLDERKEWFLAHQDERYPLVVTEEKGKIVAWGSVSPFRPRPAYRFTGETSIYVREDMYGRGIGTLILAKLIELSKAGGLHSLIGIIVDGNQASIKLHKKFGFQIVGNFKEVGYKFDTWLDVVMMQKIL